MARRSHRSLASGREVMSFSMPVRNCSSQVGEILSSGKRGAMWKASGRLLSAGPALALVAALVAAFAAFAAFAARTGRTGREAAVAELPRVIVAT